MSGDYDLKKSNGTRRWNVTTEHFISSRKSLTEYHKELFRICLMVFIGSASVTIQMGEQRCRMVVWNICMRAHTVSLLVSPTSQLTHTSFLQALFAPQVTSASSLMQCISFGRSGMVQWLNRFMFMIIGGMVSSAIGCVRDCIDRNNHFHNIV